MRVFAAIIASFFLNFLLFLLMHHMVSGRVDRIVKKEVFQGIEFVRLKREAESPRLKTRPVPKRHSPSKRPTPPPRTQLTKQVATKIEKMNAVMPDPPVSSRIRVKPFLGKFVPDPPPVVSAPVIVEKEVVSVDPSPAKTNPVSVKRETAPVDRTLGEIESMIVETDVIPIMRIPPRYPRRAVRGKIEGIVTVEFTITRDGSVADPYVVESAPSSVFDHAALQAIRKWKFKPKLFQGKPVSRRALQNIRFNLRKD